MHVYGNSVVRSRIVHTSSAIQRAWSRFARKWLFYGDLFSWAKVKFSEVFTQTDRNFASDFNQIWYL